MNEYGEGVKAVARSNPSVAKRETVALRLALLDCKAGDLSLPRHDGAPQQP